MWKWIFGAIVFAIILIAASTADKDRCSSAAAEAKTSAIFMNGQCYIKGYGKL